MSRSRPKTRRHPRSNPRGVLRVMRSGYGFVQAAEGEFYIPSSKMNGAFDGDTVELLRISGKDRRKREYAEQGKRGEKPTARVLRVIERAHESLVGRYEIAEPFGIVVPEDPKIPYDIFTMRSESLQVADGDMVRVRITGFPSRNVAATGFVEEVIGHENDAALGIEMIIARHRLETSFSEGSLQQAHRAEVDAESALEQGYRDLQERYIFTIDPEDARDFDDAVSLDKIEGLWRLGVHIADVSYYVPWGSSVDLDARRRAMSTYLVDRVIPMLPENLSSEICSLKQGETRRALTVDMYLDSDQKVQKYEIYPSLIQSNTCLSYEQAQGMLEGDADSEVATKLRDLHVIALGLAQKRRDAGGIDFETKEAKVRLDPEGNPLDIVVRSRTDATNIIEEAMILTNITVAHHLHEREFPSVYRVHEAPSPESLAELIPIFQEFKYLDDISDAEFVTGNPQCVQEVLRRSRGRIEADMISSLVLRSMKRAHYQESCVGHYGLAAKEYTHFTSPIRRYPDLIVHRMLKAQLFGKPETYEQQVNNLEWLAEHSSKRERTAEAASRESQELKMVEYLEDSVGQIFDAVISGVTSFGFFVRLENTAEGLVPMKALGNEYFSYDPAKYILAGQDSGRTYRLGQRIRVMLVGAYPRKRELDFQIASDTAQSGATEEVKQPKK